MAMTISLPADVEQKIRSKVQSGEYASEGDLIVAALNVLEEKEQSLKREKASLRQLVDERYQSAVQNKQPSLTPSQLQENLRRHHEQYRSDNL